MFSRTSKSIVKKSARQYPIVALLGPRQSGKTTLAKICFPKKKYVSLENPESRLFAETDPKGFLNQFPNGVILDEIQRVPHLFSYLQVLSDEKNKNGFFIITGSQNYLLMEKISQSLAGRVALHTLLPLSQQELGKDLPSSIYDALFKGGYPRVHKEGLNPAHWAGNYVQTYVERDVRELKNVSDLSAFFKIHQNVRSSIGATFKSVVVGRRLRHHAQHGQSLAFDFGNKLHCFFAAALS